MKRIDVLRKLNDEHIVKYLCNLFGCEFCPGHDYDHNNCQNGLRKYINEEEEAEEFVKFADMDGEEHEHLNQARPL